ncbi:MAG TPA: response regulator transcription factor [Candidatus Limnocylindrales bacterium]|nr:response regulator transcription factor [Candidatus Limnocylindrales bacterium]
MENRPLILVADDQPEITKLVSLSLDNEGFRVITASDGASALEQLSESNPDVLLLDIMMPGMSGLDVLREVREHHPVPVIMLTARAATAQVSEGLNLGADDYVVKPFHPGELAARIRAVMRRSRRGMVAGKHRVAQATVDLDRRRVDIDGRPVRMSRSEWLLLELFLANEGRILLHHEILTHVWGPEYRDEIAYLRLWIGQLRRKLGIPPWEEGAIRTIQGLGYAFDPEEKLPRMQSRRPRGETRTEATATSA